MKSRSPSEIWRGLPPQPVEVADLPAVAVGDAEILGDVHDLASLPELLTHFRDDGGGGTGAVRATAFRDWRFAAQGAYGWRIEGLMTSWAILG